METEIVINAGKDYYVFPVIERMKSDKTGDYTYYLIPVYGVEENYAKFDRSLRRKWRQSVEVPRANKKQPGWTTLAPNTLQYVQDRLRDHPKLPKEDPGLQTPHVLMNTDKSWLCIGLTPNQLTALTERAAGPCKLCNEPLDSHAARTYKCCFGPGEYKIDLQLLEWIKLFARQHPAILEELRQHHAQFLKEALHHLRINRILPVRRYERRLKAFVRRNKLDPAQRTQMSYLLLENLELADVSSSGRYYNQNRDRDHYILNERVEIVKKVCNYVPPPPTKKQQAWIDRQNDRIKMLEHLRSQHMHPNIKVIFQDDQGQLEVLDRHIEFERDNIAEIMRRGIPRDEDLD